jgi:hypothetical protein
MYSSDVSTFPSVNTEELLLWGNSMSSTISDSIFNLTHLKVLKLQTNSFGFKGPIKSEVGNLLHLEELVLNDSPLLAGTLPTESGLCQNLSESLQHF